MPSIYIWHQSRNLERIQQQKGRRKNDNINTQTDDST